MMPKKLTNSNEHTCSICETSINEILERFSSKTSKTFSTEKLNETCACQDCLIKIDEYDLAYTDVLRIENELINLIIASKKKTSKIEISGISFKHEIKNSPTQYENDNADNINTLDDLIVQDNDFNDDDDLTMIKKDDMNDEEIISSTNFTAECAKCNIKFKNIKELSEHKHIFELLNSSEQSVEVIQRDLSKDKNKVSYKDQNKILQLTGFTKVPKIEKCSVCDAEFSGKLERKKHERQHKNTFKCQICEKDFSSEALLEIHQAIHEGRPELQCQYCLKKLSSKGALVKHRRIHSQEYKYQCERCGKQFVHDTSFRMHMYAHDDTRTVTCRICFRRFRCNPHLKRHMRIHTGEKPYSCPSCGRLFAQRYNMMMHYKSHDPNGGDISCTICDKMFTSKKRRNEHLRAEHNTILEANNIKIEKKKRTAVFSNIKNEHIEDSSEIQITGD